MSKKPENPKRKAPTPKSAARKSEPKREISKFSCLVTRWRFLEAQQAYQAAIAGTDEESDELICEHVRAALDVAPMHKISASANCLANTAGLPATCSPSIGTVSKAALLGSSRAARLWRSASRWLKLRTAGFGGGRAMTARVRLPNRGCLARVLGYNPKSERLF